MDTYASSMIFLIEELEKIANEVCMQQLSCSGCSLNNNCPLDK